MRCCPLRGPARAQSSSLSRPGPYPNPEALPTGGGCGASALTEHSRPRAEHDFAYGSGLGPLHQKRATPVNHQCSGRIGTSLTQCAGSGADAVQLADVIVLAWQRIESAVGPIIGSASVALLYRRSLLQCVPAHPWLKGASQADGTNLDLAPLHAALTELSSGQAAAAGGEVLQAFYELLASLIGPHLTEQLLKPVWEHPLHGTNTQEPAP